MLPARRETVQNSMKKQEFLCFVFRRGRKIAKSEYYLRHVRPPSVRMEQLDSHWTYFYEILYLCFRRSIEKIKVLLKSDKNDGCFT
jgi:hypothetical protein